MFGLTLIRRLIFWHIKFLLDLFSVWESPSSLVILRWKKLHSIAACYGSEARLTSEQMPKPGWTWRCPSSISTLGTLPLVSTMLISTLRSDFSNCHRREFLT